MAYTDGGWGRNTVRRKNLAARKGCRVYKGADPPGTLHIPDEAARVTRRGQMSHRVLASLRAVAVVVAVVSWGRYPPLPRPTRPGRHRVERTTKARRGSIQREFDREAIRLCHGFGEICP